MSHAETEPPNGRCRDRHRRHSRDFRDRDEVRSTLDLLLLPFCKYPVRNYFARMLFFFVSFPDLVS